MIGAFYNPPLANIAFPPAGEIPPTWFQSEGSPPPPDTDDDSDDNWI